MNQNDKDLAGKIILKYLKNAEAGIQLVPCYDTKLKSKIANCTFLIVSSINSRLAI